MNLISLLREVEFGERAVIHSFMSKMGTTGLGHGHGHGNNIVRNNYLS
jgi:hypothetical protein